MRVLLIGLLASVSFIFSFSAFSAPNPPGSIWFEQNTAPKRDSDGTFAVNWTNTDATIVNYSVYVIINYAGGYSAILGKTSNSSERGLFFSNGTLTQMLGYTVGTFWGNFTFNVSGVNATGNEGSNITSDWIIVDTEAPEIYYSYMNPGDNALTNQSSVNITVYMYESYPDSAVFSWNGMNYTKDISNETSYSFYEIFRANFSAEGMYSYYVFINDTSGRSATTPVYTITYYINPPDIKLLSPQNITYNYTQIPLNYNVYDSNPIGSCWYEYNGTNATLPNCANSSFTAIRNAASTLTLWANNSFGKINSTKITFSTAVPPLVISTYPANNTALNPPSLTGISVINASITTDIYAECRFSANAGMPFAGMTQFSLTNSTVHNTTANITDNSSYPFYIKCRDGSGNVNQNDFYFAFGTLDGSNKLVIDPEGRVLGNNSVSVEVLKNGIKQFNVSVKNLALSDIQNITIAVTGANASDAPFVSANMNPNTIPANSTGNIEILIAPNGTGSFNASIALVGGLSAAGFNITITVYEDFLDDLNKLKAERIDLIERLLALKVARADVDELMSKTDLLLVDISEGVSFYNNEQYGEAKARISEIKFALADLEQKVAEKESERGTEKANGDDITSLIENGSARDRSNPSDSTGDESSGSGSTMSIVGIILLVIIVVVLATSIMPDEEDEEKEQESGVYESRT